jgi:hypothetical protein
MSRSSKDGFKVELTPGKCGPWEIERFTVSEHEARIFNLRQAMQWTAHRRIDGGTYTRLTRNGKVIMSDTPAEQADHWDIIHRAEGLVLVNGLGLGMVVGAMLGKPNVNHITVVEKDADVIELVGRQIDVAEVADRLMIVHCDAYEYEPPKGITYDVVWHDIWDNVSTENLEGMKRLHYKYGRKCRYQASWARKEVLKLKKRGW